MLANRQFLVRMTAEDKRMLARVAKHFQRSQGDTLRVMVREVYELIKTEKESPVQEPTHQEQPSVL